MIKKVAAVVLILLAGGAWGYLDYQNTKELEEAQALRAAMARARAEAQARAEARAKFEAQLAEDLTACNTAAEQAREEYILQNRVPVRRKPGQFTLPQAFADVAEQNLANAQAACQQTFESRMQNGV